MKRLSLSSILTLFMLLLICPAFSLAADKSGEKLSVLLIDGQNNHKWQETTPLLKKILENSNRFEVEVSTTPPGIPRKPRKPAGELTEAQQKQYDNQIAKWEAAVAAIKQKSAALWKKWRPDFKQYDVVVSNYNGESWPEEVKDAFDQYVSSGGSFVVVHAADNSFSDWPAYNKMIAVGGWGGRDETSGPMLRLRDNKWTRDTSVGRGGTHGSRIPVVVKVRKSQHPIIKGLPLEWMHPADEVYGKLRGPAE
ncbi:MAG: ThuA domain-containing protein, partial [Gimesia sp.]|nr:ThuA domain-containing protein [Gimesia sp.]